MWLEPKTTYEFTSHSQLGGLGIITMKCPKCKKPVERVRVYSETWQYADVNEKGEIDLYHHVEEAIDDTHSVECEACGYDLLKKGEIKL